MSMKLLGVHSGVSVLLILGLLLGSGFAAEYPSKPVTIIVGFPAGGGVDMSARAIADYFSKKWGKQFVVLNKPGGNLVPAVLEVYNSKPDGYTLLCDSNAASSIQYATIREMPYKLEDRTFLANAFLAPSVLVVSTERPWKTLKEMAEFVRREPENFRWGALGISSLATFNALEFLSGLGVDISRTKKIDFKGTPELLAALGGGHVDFVIYSVAGALPLIEANKIRPIAVVPERVDRLRNVPTTKEAGFPWIQIYSWFGLSGPPGLPKEIVAKWDQGMKDASTDPEFIARTEKIGFSVGYISSDAFRKMVLNEARTMREMAEKMGLAPK